MSGCTGRGSCSGGLCSLSDGGIVGPGGVEGGGSVGDEVRVVADEVGEHRGGDVFDEVVQRGDTGGAVDAVAEKSLPEGFGADGPAGLLAREQPRVAGRQRRGKVGEKHGEWFDGLDRVGSEAEQHPPVGDRDVVALQAADAADGLGVEGNEEPGDTDVGGDGGVIDESTDEGVTSGCRERVPGAGCRRLG